MIERVDQDPTGELTELFVQYRHFYDRHDDDDAAREFIRRRMAAGESLVWAGGSQGRIEGFAQVYLNHSSLRLATTWTLNDLFVAPSARGTGLGKSLVLRVLDEARADGVGAVRLETREDNAAARALYDGLGFIVRSSQPSADGFLTYEWYTPAAA